VGRHDDRHSDRHNDRHNERRELDARRQQPAPAPSWTSRLPGWKLLVLSLVGVILVILAGTGPATYFLPDTDRDSDGLVLPSRDEPDPEPPSQPDVSLTVGPEQRLTPSPSGTSTPAPPPARPRPEPAPAPPQPPRADRGTPSRPVASACRVSYRRTSSWEEGFGVRVDISNRGRQPIQGWTLRWTFRGGPVIRQLWNARFSQDGRAVTVRDEGWNAQIQPGQTVQFGFEATGAPRSADPDRFVLNGAACEASVTAGEPGSG
jgi:cellulase/cellobiase CelA1